MQLIPAKKLGLVEDCQHQQEQLEAVQELGQLELQLEQELERQPEHGSVQEGF